MFLCKTYLVIVLSTLLNECAYTVNLAGRYMHVNETELVYQLPDQYGSDPIGVVFLAHGCSHSSTDFFPKSESCPKCIGLPIEMQIAQLVLQRNLIALAVSSSDRESKCWNLMNDRYNGFAKLINHLYINVFNIKETTPLYNFGGSSGGNYVGTVATAKAIATVRKAIDIPLAGSIIQIAPYSVHHNQDYIHGKPIAFINMARDSRTCAGAERAVETLQAINVPAKAYIVHPLPITPDYFSRYGALPENYSKTLSSALKRAGYLNSDLQLVADPRESKWRDIAVKALPNMVGLGRPDSLEPDASPISELMNLAWAYHEITAQYFDEALDWLMSQQAGG